MRKVNRFISGILQITPRTVRYYVTEIEKRLHVGTRIQLVDMAFHRVNEYRGGGEDNFLKRKNTEK